MTPIDRILTEGDITWRLDRGWRIDRLRDQPGWWWIHPGTFAFPPLALTDHESAMWETLRTGPPALRPKENQSR